MTPLQHIIETMIEQDGPLSLDRFMSLCLGHPVHGYYMTRDPFGSAGDFTTAPEISQVFGELIGVWCIEVWQSMGSPRKFALAELGPGRGTLMADVLRVLSRIEKCAKAAQVHFVEMSPVLRQAQQLRVANATWHATTASLPAMPTILLANEFFDALPIRQYEREQGQTFERCVGLVKGKLQIGVQPTSQKFPVAGNGVFEDSRVRDALATHLADHLLKVGGVGLLIDYGHSRTALGDTLQAMKQHKACLITDHVGEADITSHVDFESLGRAFVQGGLRIAGLQTQGAFLQDMGLQQRTEVLVRSASNEKRADLIAASTRLAHPEQMGHLFKVMAVTGPGIPAPYPFGAR